jgi:predicted Zn-dependent protease
VLYPANVPFGASPIEIQRFDVQATAAHEFGHVIGLGHSRSSQNVMFGIAQWADYGDWKLG